MRQTGGADSGRGLCKPPPFVGSESNVSGENIEKSFCGQLFPSLPVLAQTVPPLPYV